MRRLSIRVLLPLLCVAALLTGMVGVSAAGKGIFPWREEKNGIEKIIERDGYLEGIWYPWLTHHNLGHSLTSNELMVQHVGETWGDVGIEQYGAVNIYREIYNLKALGFNILGYEGSIYGEGVLYDDYGNVKGIKSEYLKNVRLFLDICRQAEMPVLWTICCHSTTVNDYYEDGKYVWDVISQAYANPKVADQYAEKFVKPLCEVFADYPDVVVMIAATSEAENEMNDSDIGNHFENRELYGVNQENMLYFINAINETVKEELPEVTRTLCANQSDMSVYRDIDFDILGKQEYNWAGRSPVVADLSPNAPMFISEFGFGDSIQMADEAFTIKQIQFRDNFMAEGFKGWFMWCWQPDTYGTIYSLLEEDAVSKTDFRAFAYTLRYYTDNYRAAHRGEEIVLRAPVLFCNTGSGLVEWIASPEATSLDLLRSLDGGKTWTTVLSKVEPATYQTDFKGSYEDATVASMTDTDTTVMYKMVAYDDDGHTAASAPSNAATVLGPAINLVENGSFEDGLSGWDAWGANGSQFKAAAIKRSDAPHGSYVLDLQYINKEYFGLHQDGIQVKPNTNYKVTYTYKMAADATATSGYCFIRGLAADGSGTGDGGINDAVLTSKYLNQGSKTEWTTEEILFRTNDSTRLGIDFRVIIGMHFYIDSVTLTEVR